MKIQLQSIEIKNFKGISDLKFQFKDPITTIKGRNGSGKTTIFDAFLWVLFGKNAEMKTAFNVATLDGNGAIIPGLTHSVKIELECNPETGLNRDYYTLERIQVDKKNGGSTAKFFINGFDKSKKEFDEVVSKICTEQNFKAITSPFYFTSQKWQSQRECLIQLIDESKIDIPAEAREKIARLKENGITLTEYRAKLKKELSTIQKEIDEETARLSLLKGQNREWDTDFETIEKLKAEKEKQLAELEKGGTKIVELTKKKNQLELALQVAINDTKQAQNETYYSNLNRQSALKQRFQGAQREIISQTDTIKRLTAEVEALEKENAQSRERFKAVQAETLNFTENDFRCPTCGRAFEEGRIHEIQQELTTKFNANKAQQLKEIREKGQANNALIDERKAAIQAAEAEVKKYTDICKEINADPLFTAELKEVTEVIDTEIIAQMRKDIEAVADELKQCELNSEIEKQKSELKNQIASFNQTLGRKALIAENTEKIKKSEAYIKSENEEYSKVEAELADLAEVQNAINAGVEAQVNGLFKLTKFKLFATQVNGEVVETCEATHNGIPYSDLNNAARINVGLDIISVLSQYLNIKAPIFIDNAESVNQILETESQQIRLMVSSDAQLTIDTPEPTTATETPDLSNLMKVAELLKIVSENKFYSLSDAEDAIEMSQPHPIKVESDIEIDKHRWYETGATVYQCADGFVKVWGLHDLWGDNSAEDIDCECIAAQVKRGKVASYEYENI